MTRDPDATLAIAATIAAIAAAALALTALPWALHR